MQYKCDTCRGVVPNDQPRLTYVVRGTGGEVLRELLVCRKCFDALAKQPTIQTTGEKHAVPDDATE